MTSEELDQWMEKLLKIMFISIDTADYDEAQRATAIRRMKEAMKRVYFIYQTEGFRYGDTIEGFSRWIKEYELSQGTDEER